MAEYIEREALKEVVVNLRFGKHLNKDAALNLMDRAIDNLTAADVVEVAELKEFAEDVVYQFGYKFKNNDGLYLTTGGLSTLESAFAILGWPDPKPFPEGECEWDGCHEYATCGTQTPDGYKRVCCEHFVVIKSRPEAEKSKNGR